ncbi:MAG: sortase [Catenulispora sp.]|nr:sortase [Catenulispora sp.]
MTRTNVVGASLTILAVLLLGFVANLALVGELRHERDQHVAYATLREQLANATAPTGQTDAGGDLLPAGTPIALLQIPQIGLNEVVFEGTTGSVLASGPGHRRDTPLPGQAGASVIMGRRAAFGGPFSDIAALVRDDRFTVVTGQGRQVYRVIGVRVAGDPQPAPLAAGAGRLTLVTADGSALAPSGVLRVDAALESPVVPSPSRPIAPGAITAAEQPLASDTSEWIMAVLLGQALLILSATTVWVRVRWGRWQTWTAATPLLVALGLALADHVAFLLPNLT